MIMKHFWNNFVFPNKPISEYQEFKGGHVWDPIPGIHQNVAILDYISLYPTIISTYNLSPETFITSHQFATARGLDIDKDIIPILQKRNIKYVDTGYS